MQLELRIIKDPCADRDKQRVRVFGENGGSIGRGLDNHWVLPDPGCFLSGQHCEIVFRKGTFRVIDTSRNGVFVNGSKKPLGFRREASLQDGDALRLATYIVRVRLSARRDRSDHVTQLSTAGRAETTGEHEVAAHEADATRAVGPSEPEKSDLPTGPVAPPAPGAQVEPTAVEHLNATDATGEHALAVTAPDQPAEAELLATRTLDPAAMLESTARRVLHIDRAKLQAAGYLPPDDVERLISNQFRHIKRPLVKNALGKGADPVPNGRLVMVTSSLPGEGKTFSSINLALSIAREKDLDVVLVDADVAKQHVSRVFGMEKEPGLLDALADDRIDVETLILNTDVRGLSMLSAGRCSEEDAATELLASARMEAIAARIGAGRANRIVLFDSPPLLLTNESRVLASLVGQILLVVRAGVTPRQAVLEAIGYVDEETPLGIILNQSAGHAPGSYYGYGSYGYGAYGRDGAEGGSVSR